MTLPVPLSTFRANLPHYIALLQEGTQIMVTKHGRDVALVTKPEDAAGVEDPPGEELMERLLSGEGEECSPDTITPVYTDGPMGEAKVGDAVYFDGPLGKQLVGHVAPPPGPTTTFTFTTGPAQLAETPTVTVSAGNANPASAGAGGLLVFADAAGNTVNEADITATTLLHRDEAGVVSVVDVGLFDLLVGGK